MITLEHFDEVDMRVGTITAVSLNKRARKPAYKITVDLGDFGTKNSSAQLTNYEPEELVGKQVVCVCNFEPMRIGDVKSEVRLLFSSSLKLSTAEKSNFPVSSKESIRTSKAS